VSRTGAQPAADEFGRLRQSADQNPYAEEGRPVGLYAVLIYANDSAHALGAPAADTESCDEHAEELKDAGSMLVAYALTPRSSATSVRADGTSAGPFLDAPEVVTGFYVIEAPDLPAALAIAGTNPVIREGGGVEVRPVHSGGVLERAPHSAATIPAG
jgi:hypothetical protein